MATINLSKSPTYLGNFCKGVKIDHFSTEIILGNIYRHLGIFLVTLMNSNELKFLLRQCSVSYFYNVSYTYPSAKDTYITATPISHRRLPGGEFINVLSVSKTKIKSAHIGRSEHSEKSVSEGYVQIFYSLTHEISQQPEACVETTEKL